MKIIILFCLVIASQLCLAEESFLVVIKSVEPDLGDGFSYRTKDGKITTAVINQNNKESVATRLTLRRNGGDTVTADIMYATTIESITTLISDCNVFIIIYKDQWKHIGFHFWCPEKESACNVSGEEFVGNDAYLEIGKGIVWVRNAPKHGETHEMKSFFRKTGITINTVE